MNRSAIAALAVTCVLGGATGAIAQTTVDLSNSGASGTAVKWSGPSASAAAGTSMLRADMSGDVDRQDLIVGAPAAGPNAEGQAYILFMGPPYSSGSIAPQASATLTGEASGDQFGAAVAAGMIIRKEVAPLPPRDLLVSAPAAQGGRGVVYLFPGLFKNGDNRSAAAAPFRIIGAPGDNLGTAILAADLDGDGYRDIIMTAPGSRHVYVVFGGASLAGTLDLGSTAADITIAVPNGPVALTAADWNNDGFKDLALGVQSAGFGTGTVYLIKGRSRSMFAASIVASSGDAQFTGVSTGDAAGTSLDAADFNGDGVSDLIIGAPGASGPSNTRAGAGNVYVLYGKSAFGTSMSLASADTVIYGKQAGAALGTSIGSGQVRRSLARDLLLLAPGDSTAGDIDIVYGRSRTAVIDLANGIDRVLRGDSSGSPLQSAITMQITGKGDDVIAAAPSGSGSFASSGVLYAVFSPTLQLSATTTSITVAQGATGTTTVNISNAGSIPVGFAVRSNTSWLSVSPSSGTSNSGASAALTLTISPGNLAAGTYQGGFSYVSTSGDLEWSDTGSVALTVTSGSGGTQPTNLFGLPSDPDEGSSSGVSTPVGTNVTVVPVRDFLVRFANVTQAGRTTVTVQTNTALSSDPALREGAWQYLVQTTAKFTGTVTVAAAYQNFSTDEADVRLLSSVGDATTNVDTSMHAVYGTAPFLSSSFTFVEDRRRSVSITHSGSGTATLTQSPAGFSCGSNCVDFPAGTRVTFTAAPASNSTFAGWGGICSGTSATCTVTMPTARTSTQSLTLTANLQNPCDALTLSSTTIPVRGGGGSANVNVSTASGCSWTASSGVGWVSVTSGSSGHGSGTVRLSIGGTSNMSRVGQVTIGGQTVTVIQRGTTGDFTGDGIADLAVFRPAGGMWYVGSSMQRQFGQTSDIPVPGDYNGDRVTELALFRPMTGQWFVNNQGAFQFGRPGDIPVPADYDGDGRTDIAVFRPSTGMWYVNGVSSLGAVQFGGPGDIPVPADYNGDGKAEIAFFRPSDATWHVYGVATDSIVAFGAPGDIPVPGDYTGTGSAVMTVFRPSTGQWILRGGSPIQFGVPGDIPMALDMDGSGHASIVVFRRWTGMWYSENIVSGGTTANKFGMAGDVPLGETPRYRRQTTTDFNGDRRADIGAFNGPSAGWTLGWSSTDFTTNDSFTFGANADIPVPADYDGDGRADLATFRPSTGQWFITTSSSDFAVTLTYQWGVTGDIPVPGDYDGDGKADIAVFRPSTGMWYYGMSGSGANFSGNYGAQKFGINGDIPIPGDYDGDGKTDIAVFRPSSGMWYYGYSSTNFASSGSIQWGLSTDMPVPGDYDGDGKTDVAVFRPSTHMWYLGSSSTNFASYQTINWGTSSDTPVIGDFDGDGQSDIGIFRPSTTTWFLPLSSKGFQTNWSPVLGNSGDTLVPHR